MSEQFKGEFVCKCICGGDICTDDEMKSLLHSMPTCAKFDAMDPEDFIVWVRETKGLPSPHPEDMN